MPLPKSGLSRASNLRHPHATWGQAPKSRVDHLPSSDALVTSCHVTVGVLLWQLINWCDRGSSHWTCPTVRLTALPLTVGVLLAAALCAVHLPAHIGARMGRSGAGENLGPFSMPACQLAPCTPYCFIALSRMSACGSAEFKRTPSPPD